MLGKHVKSNRLLPLDPCREYHSPSCFRMLHRRLRQCGSTLALAPTCDHLGQIRPGRGAALAAGLDHTDRQREGARALFGAGPIADAPRDDPVAQCPFRLVMPRPGLCRVGVAHRAGLRGAPDSWPVLSRHNQRFSRNANRGSGGWNRSGATPQEVECASARSLICMSA
jgi:hypothetical protein